MSDISLPREFPGGRLRRLHPADLEAFQSYRSIPELSRYQGWSHMPHERALEFLVEMNSVPLFASGKWHQLGIADQESDSLIGDIGLHVSEDGEIGEVGFTLKPSAQGRGIATGAVNEALQILFGVTKVAHVLGITDDRNLSSIRLLERLGFQLREIRNAVFKQEACIEKVYVLPRVR